MTERDTWRTRLRRLPALAGPLPTFDPLQVPRDPADLFVRWFDEAVDDGVPEPQAMTVATADAGGTPSSRVVVLKDLRDGAWEFATDARSRKARDLVGNPQAAISFYWQPQGRQIRLSGTVIALDEEACAQDFLARSPASRAAALATRPGEPLASPADLAAAVSRARRQVEQDGQAVLSSWTVYALRPVEAEFWQGDPGRAHIRVRYRRDGTGLWEHTLVWP